VGPRAGLDGCAKYCHHRDLTFKPLFKEGSGGKAVLIHNVGTVWKLADRAMTRPIYPRKGAPIGTVQAAMWVPGSVSWGLKV
jgi:hypothetical protein